MADIAPEIYEKIKETFNRQYDQAQLLGEPLHDVMNRIKSGDATYTDADLYAVTVGSMMADAIKANLKLEELPGKQLYRNISQKTIGEGLKDTYGLVSNICRYAQEEMNTSIGVNLKPVTPKLETSRVDNIVNKAAVASTQEALDATLDNNFPTFAQQVVDDSKKANARQHNKAGLSVKVEREYDGVGLHEGTDVCDWCLQRAGTWTYEKAMSVGAFERHEGCGCIITYTSAKGEKTVSVSKYDGWMDERDQRVEEAKQENAAKAKRYAELRKDRIAREKNIIELQKNANSLNRSRQYKTVEELKLRSESSILSKETYNDIVKYFEDNYNIHIKGFDNKTLDDVKITLAGFDDFIKVFPEAADRIKSIEYNSHIKDYGKMSSLGKGEIGHDGLGDYGTGVHEAAHALDFELSAPGTTSFSKSIVPTARKNLGLRENQKEYSDLVTKTTGQLGERRSEEIFAFAMETEFGGLSNVLSKEIFSLVKNR